MKAYKILENCQEDIEELVSKHKLIFQCNEKAAWISNDNKMLFYGDSGDEVLIFLMGYDAAIEKIMMLIGSN